MTKTDRAAAPSAADEIVIERVFAAPRALVFAAWTEPAHLAQWTGPKGFTVSGQTHDLQVGGMFRACLHAPDGTDHWLRGVYREITPPERLVFTHAWDTKDGGTGPESLVTVILAEDGTGTRMTFRQTGFESTGSRDSHREGWSECFDLLAELLAKLQHGNAEGTPR